MRRSYPVLAGVAVLALVLACGGGGDGGTQPNRIPSAIVVSAPSADSLFSIGQTVQLSAVVRDQDNQIIPSPTVAWSSSAAGIATVNAATGLVSAAGAGPGSAYIRATAGSVKDSLKVNVRQRFDHLAVSPGTKTLAPNQTQQLTVTGQDARNNPVAGLPAATFGSNTTAAAEVSADGLVTAKAVGQATITATVASTADGTKQGTSVITVQAAQTNADVNATTSRTFTPTPVTIPVNGTVTWHFASLTHNVTFATQTGAPANIANSQNTTVARTFGTAGTFDYECTLHAGMTGQVIVTP